MELLSGMRGMYENIIFTQKLKYFVKNTTNTLKISVILPDWYNQLLFGIFGQVLRQLMTIKSSKFIVMEKKRALVFEV